MKTIYLSGGIQDFSNPETHNWREKSKTLLGEIPTLDPTRFLYDGDYVKLVEMEKIDIDASSHMLVYFIRPSVGTSMEIIYAWERQKKVYVVNEAGADLSSWILYHSTQIFPTLEEAVQQIKID